MAANTKNRYKVLHFISIFIFGLVLPAFLLINAYLSLGKMQDIVSSKEDIDSVFEQTLDFHKEVNLDKNAYAYLSFIHATRSNEKTMVNKQILKLLVIQVGFSVISLGIMLLILGINDGGITASGQTEGFNFDVTVGSTGVAVFLIGAVMVTVGGVLKNSFSTVGVPTFSSSQPQSTTPAAEAPPLDQCEQLVGKDHPNVKKGTTEFKKLLDDCKGIHKGS